MSLRPPSLRVILIDVEPASREFSRSSLIAFAGRWMIWRYKGRGGYVMERGE
jgi:hypothetical protein